MDQDWIISFQAKLDQHYTWPALYIFKFIVPNGREDDLKTLFPSHPFAERKSTKGNYVSLTLQMMMPSSEAVIEIYKRAEDIEGLIAL